MCWVALARATALAGVLGVPERVDSWAETQSLIADAIISEGWSERLGAFTQSFGSEDLDASNLMMPLVGFLPADDQRVVATIEATEQHLTDARGLVQRYRAADGLAGGEGAFLLCTFWLAQALAMAGQPERARKVFERTLPFVNDVGLLAEEVDSTSGELLGNYPQALSHIGLVNAAWAISQAEGSHPDDHGTRQRSQKRNPAPPEVIILVVRPQVSLPAGTMCCDCASGAAARRRALLLRHEVLAADEAHGAHSSRQGQNPTDDEEVVEGTGEAGMDGRDDLTPR